MRRKESKEHYLRYKRRSIVAIYFFGIGVSYSEPQLSRVATIEPREHEDETYDVIHDVFMSSCGGISKINGTYSSCGGSRLAACLAKRR